MNLAWNQFIDFDLPIISSYLGMNTEALHVALQQSFSPDANIRNPAELIIKNLKHTPGACRSLIEIASEKQVRATSYLTASLYLSILYF